MAHPSLDKRNRRRSNDTTSQPAISISKFRRLSVPVLHFGIAAWRPPDKSRPDTRLCENFLAFSAKLLFPIAFVTIKQLQCRVCGAML
jgi:hypothetical protein